VRVLPVIIFLIPLLTLADSEGDPTCSIHYGLDVCTSTFGFGDEQINYSEKKNNTFDTTLEKHQSLLGTNLTDEDMNQIQRENAFKNIDSFRAYMKTIENRGHTSNDSEFSVKKRILDSTDFDLDCRIVADSIYELPNSQYYDCALQRYF
jgi:hypothetical protein